MAAAGRAAVGLALIGLSAYSLQAYYAGFEKEDWRGAAEYVGAAAEPGDLVLFSAPWGQIPFDYYYRQQETPVEMRGVPVDLFTRGELEPAMREADLPALRDLIAGRDRVWLVYAHEWYADAGGLIPQELEREMLLADKREFNGPRMYRYER